MVTSKANGFSQTRSETKIGAHEGIWERLRLNEWTFSLSLLAFTLSVALGKLCVNYGCALWWPLDGRNMPMSIPDYFKSYSTSDTASIRTLHNVSAKQQWETSEKLMNISVEYEEAIASVVISATEKWGWLMKAFVCGLTMTGFTWYIIYKDSHIPGVNPPSPFNPSKQRYRSSAGLQLNYLVGLLNGILIFLYMCL